MNVHIADTRYVININYKSRIGTINRFPSRTSRFGYIAKTLVAFLAGCLDDIRLEGKHLPLPPAMNGTQWGQATMARNLERNCPSNKPCANVICPEPFECVDLWNDYECT